MHSAIKRIINSGQEHFFYVGATIISAAFHFIYSIFVKEHIEPLEYGIYSTCLLLQTYMQYAQLGILNSFNRDYPQLIGAGDVALAKKYRDNTFTFLLAVFSGSTVIVSGMVIVMSRGTDSRYMYGFILCALISTITVIESFLASRVRIEGSFKFTSFVMIAELVAICIGFVIIPRIGYYGLYYVTIVSMLIGIMLYYRAGVADLRFSADKELIKSAVLSGLPLLINGLIWTVINSIDKFVILGFMQTEDLGLYSIAQMAFSYMVLIPNAMSQLFYVRLGKVYGATNSIDELNQAAMNYTLVLSVIVSVIILCVYYFIEPLVVWRMPKYSDGVKAAQILLLGLAIYAPTMVNGNILTLLKKNASLLRGSVYLCLFNVVFSVGLVLLRGAKIENVALGTSISYFLRTVILMFQLKKYAGANVIGLLKASVIPVIITATPGIVLYHLLNSKACGFLASLFLATAVIVLIYYKNVKDALVNH